MILEISANTVSIDSSILTSGSISMTINADYGFVFVTFDVTTASNQQICVFLIQSSTAYSS